jgi:lipopolysaccharide biosynthesis glycosyltransferase
MKPITIVVASDDNYLVLLAALINSIELNLKEGNSIDLWVIEDNVSETNKAKLQSSINDAITQLHWQSMNEVIPRGIELPLDRSSYPLNIYMRLFIPYFIPSQVEKVLYLDVDMIVQKDISTLYAADLGDALVGAVLDPRIITFDNSWGGVLNYAELGLDAKTRYFNTGLLLIPTKKWLEENIPVRIINCIEENKKFANYPDQYGMNVVLANQWLELDPLWNHFCTIEHPNPYLIHFVQRKPIFKSYNNSEKYQKIFYQYLSNTAWKNEKPRGESGRYLKKLKNISDKILKQLGLG